MEIVHVVAINPYRKGNKGKVFSYQYCVKLIFNRL